MEKIRVLVADDHPMVRIGIRKFLEKYADIEVIGEAADGQQALRYVEKLSPEILILDLEMPRMDGLQVLHQLQKRHSSVRVLVLSAYDDNQLIQGAMEIGIAGFLSKDEMPENLIEAVRQVSHQKQVWLSPRTLERMHFASGLDRL